jgi:hypothetical protein
MEIDSALQQNNRVTVCNLHYFQGKQITISTRLIDFLLIAKSIRESTELQDLSRKLPAFAIAQFLFN